MSLTEQTRSVDATRRYILGKLKATFAEHHITSEWYTYSSTLIKYHTSRTVLLTQTCINRSTPVSLQDQSQYVPVMWDLTNKIRLPIVYHNPATDRIGIVTIKMIMNKKAAEALENKKLTMFYPGRFTGEHGNTMLPQILSLLRGVLNEIPHRWYKDLVPVRGLFSVGKRKLDVSDGERVHQKQNTGRIVPGMLPARKPDLIVKTPEVHTWLTTVEVNVIDYLTASLGQTPAQSMDKFSADHYLTQYSVMIRTSAWETYLRTIDDNIIHTIRDGLLFATMYCKYLYYTETGRVPLQERVATLYDRKTMRVLVEDLQETSDKMILIDPRSIDKDLLRLYWSNPRQYDLVFPRPGRLVVQQSDSLATLKRNVDEMSTDTLRQFAEMQSFSTTLSVAVRYFVCMDSNRRGILGYIIVTQDNTNGAFIRGWGQSDTDTNAVDEMLLVHVIQAYTASPINIDNGFIATYPGRVSLIEKYDFSSLEEKKYVWSRLAGRVQSPCIMSVFTAVFGIDTKVNKDMILSEVIAHLQDRLVDANTTTMQLVRQRRGSLYPQHRAHSPTSDDDVKLYKGAHGIYTDFAKEDKIEFQEYPVVYQIMCHGSGSSDAFKMQEDTARTLQFAVKTCIGKDALYMDLIQDHVIQNPTFLVSSLRYPYPTTPGYVEFPQIMLTGDTGMSAMGYIHRLYKHKRTIFRLPRTEDKTLVQTVSEDNTNIDTTLERVVQLIVDDMASLEQTSCLIDIHACLGGMDPRFHKRWMNEVDHLRGCCAYNWHALPTSETGVAVIQWYTDMSVQQKVRWDPGLGRLRAFYCTNTNSFSDTLIGLLYTGCLIALTVHKDLDGTTENMFERIEAPPVYDESDIYNDSTGTELLVRIRKPRGDDLYSEVHKIDCKSNITVHVGGDRQRPMYYHQEYKVQETTFTRANSDKLLQEYHTRHGAVRVYTVADDEAEVYNVYADSYSLQGFKQIRACRDTPEVLTNIATGNVSIITRGGIFLYKLNNEGMSPLV